MTAQTNTLAGASPLQRLLSKVSQLFARSPESEIEQMGKAEFDLMAHDIGLSSNDLREQIAHGSNQEILMPQMLAANRLDAEAVHQANPAVYQDMELTCSHCHSQGRCKRDMADGVAEATHDEYCLNAYTIDALKKTAQQ